MSAVAFMPSSGSGLMAQLRLWSLILTILEFLWALWPPQYIPLCVTNQNRCWLQQRTCPMHLPCGSVLPSHCMIALGRRQVWQAVCGAWLSWYLTSCNERSIAYQRGNGSLRQIGIWDSESLRRSAFKVGSFQQWAQKCTLALTFTWWPSQAHCRK